MWWRYKQVKNGNAWPVFDGLWTSGKLLSYWRRRRTPKLINVPGYFLQRVKSNFGSWKFRCWKSVLYWYACLGAAWLLSFLLNSEKGTWRLPGKTRFKGAFPAMEFLVSVNTWRKCILKLSLLAHIFIFIFIYFSRWVGDAECHRLLHGYC